MSLRLETDTQGQHRHSFRDYEDIRVFVRAALGMDVTAIVIQEKGVEKRFVIVPEPVSEETK